MIMNGRHDIEYKKNTCGTHYTNDHAGDTFGAVMLALEGDACPEL